MKWMTPIPVFVHIVTDRIHSKATPSHPSLSAFPPWLRGPFTLLLPASHDVRSNRDLDMAKRGRDEDPMDTARERALSKQLEVLESMTPEEYHRFESFRRSHFPSKVIKKVLEELVYIPPSATSPVTDDMRIVVGGLAKLFVGDITELARDVMRERGQGGPIPKTALREAYRRAKRDGVFDTGAGRLKKRRLATADTNLTLLHSKPSSLKTQLSTAVPPAYDGPDFALAREALAELDQDDEIDPTALQQELNL